MSLIRRNNFWRQRCVPRQELNVLWTVLCTEVRIRTRELKATSVCDQPSNAEPWELGLNGHFREGFLFSIFAFFSVWINSQRDISIHQETGVKGVWLYSILVWTMQQRNNVFESDKWIRELRWQNKSALPFSELDFRHVFSFRQSLTKSELFNLHWDEKIYWMYDSL